MVKLHNPDVESGEAQSWYSLILSPVVFLPGVSPSINLPQTGKSAPNFLSERSLASTLINECLIFVGIPRALSPECSYSTLNIPSVCHNRGTSGNIGGIETT